MAGSQKSAIRMTACGSVSMAIEATSCDLCEGLCWHVEVWGHDVAGTGERVCLLYRAHITSLGETVVAVSRWLVGVGGHLNKLETDAWILEHQQALF